MRTSETMLGKLKPLWYRFLGLYQIKRNNYLGSAPEYASELFDKAEQTIYIVAGNLMSDMWTRDRLVLDALERAAQRNVEIAIITGISGYKNEALLELIGQYNKINLYVFEETPESHFSVVDAKHVRVEDYHLPGQPETSWLRYNTFFLGRQLEAEFKELLAKHPSQLHAA